MCADPLKILFVNDAAPTGGVCAELVAQLNTNQFSVTVVDSVAVLSGRAVAKNFNAALLQNVAPLGAFTYLRAQMPLLPIIILVQQPDADLALGALQAGAQDFLVAAETSTGQLERAIRFAVARKQAEAPLRENETRYHAVFKNARDVAFITTADGHFIDVNRAALTMFGYSRDEFIGMDSSRLFVDTGVLKQLRRLMAKNGGVKDYGVKLRQKTGSQLDCLLNLSARRDTDNSVMEYHGIIRDVTHRKALEENWRRYEFIVNNSKEFMTLMNHNYVYEAVNESYCQAHGMVRDQIVGKSVAQVWGENVYLNVIKTTIDRCFAGEEVHFQGWLGFEALGERYMQVTYYPYHNADGIVSHIVVVSRDATDMKIAEERLNQAHIQNEQLLAAIPSILISVSSDDNVAHVNHPAEAAFGIKADDIVGKPFLECGIEWDWFEIITRIDEGRKGMKSTALNDVKYTRPDGKEGFLNITVNPVEGESGKLAGFLLIGQDVTERKILEGQLSQAQKLESIGQLAAGIAHEVNTPTQYVGDNIRFLQESFTDLSGVLDTYRQLLDTAKDGEISPELVARVEQAQTDADLEFLLDEIPAAIRQSLEGVERVSGIVRAMKEFSHPGVNQKSAIDINKAIQGTITVARNEWKYIADLNTDFDPGLPPVPCLPGEFNQAILNVIINAAHAIGDAQNGNGTKGVITVQTRQADDWVEIRVSDTGTGIPPEVRSRIFDPFFTTKDVGHGTGQGLSIARAVVVDKHGGTINFETEMNKGTTFIIRLPLQIETLPAAAATERVPIF